jgi:anti-sigma factor RsiW
MNCNRCDKAGAYVDEAMSIAEREEFRAHLSTCAECAKEAERLQRIGRFVRAAGLPEPGDLVRKFRQRQRAQKLLVRVATMLTGAAAAIIVVSGLSLILNPPDSGPASMSWQAAALSQQIDSPSQSDPDDPIAKALLQDKP